MWLNKRTHCVRGVSMPFGAEQAACSSSSGRMLLCFYRLVGMVTCLRCPASWQGRRPLLVEGRVPHPLQP